MHPEILDKKQTEMLPWLKPFYREFYLVGGTAIALYLGHRRSIDFDLFKFGKLNHRRNIEKLQKTNMPISVTRRVGEQMNLIMNGVKITFFDFQYDIPADNSFEKYFRMPTLLDLAAMKAYALGMRLKWKDYVDLCFLLDKFSIQEIAVRANELFPEMFSEKLFRVQLSFFKKIDYSEEIEWVIPNPPTEDEIKEKLTEIATKL